VYGVLSLPVYAEEVRLTDRAVSDAVEDELLRDSMIPQNSIHVMTSNGIVDLTGTVDNILVQKRASRIAEIVRGVRSVINRIDVNPLRVRSDEQIREDLAAALSHDPATKTYKVSAAVKDGVVTLSGSVHSFKENNLCVRIAEDVSGVKKVNSDIAVYWSQKRSDEQIQKEVERSLKWDTFVDHAQIQVEVNHAKILLKGVVGSASEKRWAGLDAQVLGIESVDVSGLKVNGWARDKNLKGEKYEKKSANEITAAIKESLALDPRTSSFDVTPEINASVVTLRGTVDNLKAKRAAAQDAQNTVGVSVVDNRLKVKPPGSIGDGEIEKAIQGALRRDAIMERYDIDVDVINGVAKLYGTVENYFEKFQADDIASKISGVIAVQNRLKVENEAAPYIFDPYVDEGYGFPDKGYAYRLQNIRIPGKTDRIIKADIENELLKSPFVNADDVSVSVEQDKVTLRGVVDSWSEYNAALMSAYKGGAVFVNNEIRVK